MAAWLRSWTPAQSERTSEVSSYQYAVLDGPGRYPVEHPRAVVLHLRLDEVEVPGLVVSNAHVQLAGHDPVGGVGVRPEGKRDQYSHSP